MHILHYVSRYLLYTYSTYTGRYFTVHVLYIVTNKDYHEADQ